MKDLTYTQQVVLASLAKREQDQFTVGPCHKSLEDIRALERAGHLRVVRVIGNYASTLREVIVARPIEKAGDSCVSSTCPS